MLSAARGLTDPLACDPVPDLVGPSGFKINGGRVSGLPQGVFVGGDSLPKVEGRGDRFDPETEVRPAPGQPLAPAVGYPQHRVLEVFRIPFDGDAVAFRLVDEGDPRLLWVCDENDLVDLDAEWNPREVDGRPSERGAAAMDLFDDLPVVQAVTEMDAPTGTPVTEDVLRRQGSFYKSTFDIFRKQQAENKNIFSVTVWGLADEKSWRSCSGAPLVFDNDYDGKWAYAGILGLDIPKESQTLTVFGAADALDPASQTWEFMPETRISDEASFQARWNDKGSSCACAPRMSTCRPRTP